MSMQIGANNSVAFGSVVQNRSLNRSAPSFAGKFVIKDPLLQNAVINDIEAIRADIPALTLKNSINMVKRFMSMLRIKAEAMPNNETVEVSMTRSILPELKHCTGDKSILVSRRKNDAPMHVAPITVELEDLLFNRTKAEEKMALIAESLSEPAHVGTLKDLNYDPRYVGL